jgi:hypothetical protein
VTAGLFDELTRAELDEWIAAAEQAERLAMDRLAECPLEPGAVQAAAGVATDARVWLVDLYETSMAMSVQQMITGEAR